MPNEKTAETIFAAVDAAVIFKAASQARALHRPYGLVAVFGDFASTEAYKAFRARTLQADPGIKEIEFISRSTIHGGRGLLAQLFGRRGGVGVNIPDRICLWFEKPTWFKRSGLEMDDDRYVTSEKILDAVRPPPPQGFRSAARRPD